ncbi:MAG: carbon-nitrogen hydrolase family protein [Candidatus Odinarchaeota archaeon]
MIKITYEEELLEKALKEENSYNWKETAILYEQIAKSYLDKGDQEKAAKFYYNSGLSFFDAVYASEDVGELKENSENLLRTLKEAVNINKEIGNLSDELECKGLTLLIQAAYFIESKQEVINSAINSIEYLNRAIKLHDKEKISKNDLARKLYINLLATAFLVYCSPDASYANKSLQKGFDFAYEAWKISKNVKNLRYMTESLYMEGFLWNLLTMLKDFKQDNQWKEHLRNFLLRCDESQKIIGECESAQILGSLYFSSGLAYFNFGFHYIEEEVEQRKYLDKGINLIEKSIEFVRDTGNFFALIECLYNINFYALVAGRINYLQKRIGKDINEVIEKGIVFKTSSLPMYICANYLPAFYYSNVAQWSFFNTKQRMSYAKKGIEYAEKALENSVSEVWNCFLHQAASWSYSQLISLTTIKEEREKSIQKMIRHANQAKENSEKFEGGLSRAIGFSSLYRAYRTLADIADNKQEKINMLNIAIDASKNYIKHAMESRTGNISARLRLGLLHEEIGILTSNNDTFIQAKELFDNLIDECIEKRYYSYAAAACEYNARIEDRLGNYTVSATYYEKAKSTYLESLKNVEYKLLKNRVIEKVHYVDAWSFIENAKGNHKKENHLKAKEDYEKANEILKDLPNFKFESIYYFAWATQEEAERLSKLEMHREATEEYEKTKKVFADSMKAMDALSNKIKDKFTIKRIKKLEKVAQLRIKYCSARSNIEKARILAKQGEYCASAELFASAASEFRDVCNLFKNEREREELEAVYYLCRAWESMELAEKYTDPERFAEAADLFIKASKLFSDSKLKLLASGNSAFCQALKFGCEFDETLEYNTKVELYPKIRSILRKAASSYEKGGFKNGGNWALATSTYFDAAWSLIQADEELEFGERKKLLGIGSEYLKSAAELFSRSGYHDKEKEVLKRLGMVKKEEKIIFSALNSIKKPNISGSTVGIIAPACAIETSQSPRLGEVNQFTQEEIRVLGERVAKKRYEIVYRDLFKEYPRVQKREFTVGIAQIGISETGDILDEFYKMNSSGLLSLREDKVENVKTIVKNMIEKAHKEGVNVLLFPEMTIDLNYGDFLEEISNLTKLYQMYVIPGSYHDKETKRNVAKVFGPDGILWEQEKHISAIIHHRDGKFKEGINVGDIPQNIFICNTEYGRIAIAICRDFLDMDLRVELKNFEPPVDIILNPAFTPVTADFKAIHFDARRSIYAYCFFANVAEFGDSLIYTPEKDRTERTIPAKEEGLIYKDIDLFKLRSERKRWEKEQKKELQFIQSTR